MDLDIEKFFNLSLDMLCIASVDGYFKRINPAFEQTLGWSSEELLSRPFLEFVHPEDVPATMQELEKLASGIPTVSFENRYECADGTYKHLLWTSYPESDTGLLYAVARDVTEIRLSQEKFQVALESSPSAMIMVDEKGDIALINKETERLFGYAREELIGKSIQTLVPEGSRKAHAGFVRDFFTQPRSRPMGEARDLAAKRKDGSLFPAQIGLNPIQTSDGFYVLSAIVDLTERKEIEDQMQEQAQKLERANTELFELASTDSLTELMNRRALLNQLDIQLNLAQRSGRPTSLLMIDVDHFKEYNDTYGHPAGDQVLKELAGILRDTARISDFVARYGGEEFAVVLPETDMEGALKLGERFRAAAEDHPWPNRNIAISVGAATITFTNSHQRIDPGSTSKLIADADRALYHSKQRGRNRVTHLQELAEGR